MKRTRSNLFIQVINGPNMNLLGIREPNTYTSVNLETINERLKALAKDEGADLECFQSNHEGELVSKIQALYATKCDGILINPAAYGHTSIAIRDALKAVAIPFVEVHVSNVHAQEPFVIDRCSLNSPRESSSALAPTAIYSVYAGF